MSSMKIFNLYLLIILPALLIQNETVNAKDKNLFYNHNSKAGFRALEIKLNKNLTVFWSNKNSTPVYLSGGLTAKVEDPRIDRSKIGIKFLKNNKQLFGLKNPAKELEVISATVGADSLLHLKYRQLVDNIPILDSEINLHFNADGSIEYFDGRYFPTPDLNTNVIVTEAEALAAAKKIFDQNIAKYISVQLAIIDTGAQLKSAYLVTFYEAIDNKFDVFLDAVSGEFINNNHEKHVEIFADGKNARRK
jgi:Zn-dependent metalloprotease